MTKADLVEKVVEAIGPGVTTRDCKLMVDGFLAAVKEALARGEGVELRGFGTLKVRHRKARKARRRSFDRREISRDGSNEGITLPFPGHPRSSSLVMTRRLETVR